MLRLLAFIFFVAFEGMAKPITCSFKLQLPALQDSFKLDVFKCYVSHFRFYNQNNELLHSDANAFLMDFTDSVLTQTIVIECPHKEEPTSIMYSIGLDSLTNTSGALSGQLDPLKGMFWTWQSGYIHIKMEGAFLNSQSQPAEWQFHLGGYRWPNATLLDKQVLIKQKNAIVEIQLNEFLKQLNKDIPKKVMSPSPMAKQLFLMFSNSFSSM